MIFIIMRYYLEIKRYNSSRGYSGFRVTVELVILIISVLIKQNYIRPLELFLKQRT